MKRLSIMLTACAAFAGLVSCTCNSVKPAIPADPEIEKAIEKTLAKMTIEEKVGQMTEIAIDVVGGWGPGGFTLDQEKLQNAIGTYKVGSILNTPMVGQTPEKW